ncbi:hypothetical protein C8Q74DRAFT_1374129 [Fomes fomentarius]|nr:hypothetical protein C8Q74DRAFT_1374129 [Fomes fomentarius]
MPKDIEEGMLLTVFSMRIEDQPSQLEKMREALSVIAEVTNSERVRQYLTTGTDAGDSTVAKTSPGMPRGLNQLGNTCYLNSLLQYYYTIKALRAAIASLSNAGTKSDDSKLTDDHLKRHHVGGRLVTRHEILRSKKFASLLADLFWNMEYCETTAVTPAIELAKLALVTSQDEEEDEMDKAGTDSSNNTDATLVDDLAPSRSTFDRSSSSPMQLQTPKNPTGSVLGKRSRDADPESAMDGDTPAHSPPHPSADTRSPTSAEFLQTETRSSSSSSSAQKRPATGKEADVEMKNESRAGSKAPPPLPLRKARQTDDSVMMFGHQHDVSECMDNCMFQIETALLDFHGMTTSDDDKTKPVKRLFYGKKRQRLIAVSSDDDARHQSSIHEKEDLFSHLHVNVADENFDLYDSLARYFDDTVEDTKKRMEVTLVDLPPLLQIQLQRVQFNRETQQAYKSQAYVKFGETIHMDRFLDSANPQKKAQSKIIHAELTASRELELLADELLISSLRDEEAFITEQLRVEREKTSGLKQQLEDIWKDETSAAYELTSVFIHRGSSPSWGHYFFYSRNLPDHPDQWFKYNDSDVSQVSKDEVLADTTGSTANPYMASPRLFQHQSCRANFARIMPVLAHTRPRLTPASELTSQLAVSWPDSRPAQCSSQSNLSPYFPHQPTPQNDPDAGERGQDVEDAKRQPKKRKIEFIQKNVNRYKTFSKRKAGIMKKAYELSVLTGMQVLVLVVSESGTVYTFATAKLQPLVSGMEGQNLIRACLSNAPLASAMRAVGQTIDRTMPVQQQQQSAPGRLAIGTPKEDDWHPGGE